MTQPPQTPPPRAPVPKDIQISISISSGGKVVMNFNKVTPQLNFNPDQAIHISGLLQQAAIRAAATELTTLTTAVGNILSQIDPSTIRMQDMMVARSYVDRLRAAIEAAEKQAAESNGDEQVVV